MSVAKLAGCKSFKDFHYFQDQADLHTFYYIPGAPVPERNPAGHPFFSLLVAEPLLLMTVGVRWEVSSDALAELKQIILDQQPELEAPLLKLIPAPLGTLPKATLLLVDETGTETILQERISPGFPPYPTTFKIRLTPGQLPVVADALHKNRGSLVIRYTVTLLLATVATAVITGNAGTILEEMLFSATLADALRRIEKALSNGQLQLSESQSALIPEAIREKARRMAIEKAAAVLLGLTLVRSSIRELNIKAAVNLEDPAAQVITRETKVAEWFPAGGAFHLL
jgi:hypothetical protein